MDKITIKKETTTQSYAEFWSAFLFLKDMIDPNVMGWSHFKLSALTMACFAIEAFANHVGKNLFSSWDTIEKGISPIGKLKLFIEMKKIEIKYGEAPYNTVHELMKWRNKIAHGKTEMKKISTYAIFTQEYENLLNTSEQANWRDYVISVDIEKIKKDCEELMKTIHLKALGHLDWFLIRSWGSGSASTEH